MVGIILIYMKKLFAVGVFTGTFFSLFLVVQAVTILTVPQGGTGWGYPGGFVAGVIPYGNGLNPLATSSSLTFDGSKLIVTNASTTNLSATSFCLTGDICRTTWPTGASGGTIGMLAAWASATTLTATSSPTAANYIATSTTATSTFAGDVGLTGDYLIVSTTSAAAPLASLPE